MPALFSRVAVVGTGLVGGSFALAARAALSGATPSVKPGVKIVGWDRPEVLDRAKARGIVDEAQPSLTAALAGADLVYVALPVGLTIERLPEIARLVAPTALVTDAASTKREVCAAARGYFAGAPRFLGGHPMAGSEGSGVELADAALFRGARYALVDPETGPGGATSNAVGAAPGHAARDPRDLRFVELVEAIGARPMWMDAETHDRAAAMVSHLPQLLSVALARVVRDATDQTSQAGLPLTLAGRGLRDALRLAGSPYALWRDIVLTNSDNLEIALDRLAQAVEHLRENLQQRELEQQFAAANDVYKILRDLQ